MRSLTALWVLTSVLGVARAASAQGPPPRIPLLVVDLHATVPTFPSNQVLADSRLLALAELPGVGLGGDLGVHLYPLKWRAVTFGVGGHLMTAVSRGDSVAATATTGEIRAVTERFTYLAPQISLNFGTGSGWSYLSGGLGRSTWSIVPDNDLGASLPPNEEHIKTIDYGGGARWFAKPHLAFSFDVRVYAINPTRPVGPLPSGPRTTLLVVGAGISLK